jgi:predicted metal-binding membrane protein
MMRAMTLYDPVAISLFTASWTAGMAAMMFPAITPMVLLYDRLIRAGGRESRGATLVVGKEDKSNSLKLILFVGCYLLVWALTGITLLVAWSLPMNKFITVVGVEGKHELDILYGGLLVLAGLYQFSSLKTKCLGYCESPMSFFMRRWRNGVSGALKMGTYHGLYCLGCCWPYFLLMVALGWMNLLWMGLFAGIIFAEKIWSLGRVGLWVARIAGIGFIVVGLLTTFGIITLQNTVANTGSGNSHNTMFSGIGGDINQGNKDSMMMGINHKPIGVESQAVVICLKDTFYFFI